MAAKSVFVIDDDQILLRYLERKLGEAGYEVWTSSSELEAIEVLADRSVDVVFTDFFLPHLNGERICRIIRRMEHLKDVHLVIMSAAALEMQIDPAAAGADAVIAKGSFGEMGKGVIAAIEAIDDPSAAPRGERRIGFGAVSPRRMTRELLDRNRHLRAVLDSISEGIVEIYSGHVVYLNPAAERLLGRSPDRVLSSCMSDLFGADPPFLADAAAPGAASEGRPGIYRCGGRSLKVRGLTLPDDPDTLILVISDETERIQSEAALRRYQQHLETLVEKRTLDLKLAHAKLLQRQRLEALGTIAGGVAHDLNNILSGIVSYPELLLMDMPESSPLRKPVLTIQKSGEKAAAIVQDLLTLARREVASRKVLNLNASVRDYLNSPEFEAVSAYHPGMRVESRLDDNLLNIQGSAVHVGKTVMNLVSNAAEAMPEGGRVIVSTQNRYLDRDVKGYETIRKGEYAVLSVSDTGIGISDRDIGRIFEPFYTKKKMGRSGTGLGMAVVWGTVKDQKGYVDVRSRRGEGTTFELYFPATRESPADPPPSEAMESYTGRGESILVVDDAPEQREIASGILTKLGYTVACVASGEEALVYLADRPVDLVVLDMIMEPGIDGLETFRKIREVRPGQKAVIASGFSETDRIVAVQKLGAGRYIKKPYAMETIGTAVRDALGGA